MPPENDQDPTPDPTKVTITVEEYNRLKGKDGQIATLENQLNSYRTDIASLNTKLEDAIKSKNKNVSREEVEAEVRKEFGERLTQAESKASDFEKKYKTTFVIDRVLNELQKEKLQPWAVQYVRADIEKDCDLEGESIIIKDQNGQPKWSSVNVDKKMDISEYVALTKQRVPQFFGSSAREGVPESGNFQGGNINPGQDNITMDDIRNMDDKQLRALDPKVLDRIMAQTGRMI